MKTLCCVAILAAILAGCATRPACNQKAPHGIAFQALQFESGITPLKKAHANLEEIVNQAVARIQAADCELQSMECLRAINGALIQKGYFNDKVRPFKGASFAESMERRDPDCSGKALIYLEVAERCGINLDVSFSRNHVFMVMQTSKGDIFWEATEGRPYRYEHFAEQVRDPDAIASEAYMKRRGPETMLSIAAYEAGMVARQKGMFREARKLYTHATLLFPHNVNAWVSLASLQLQFNELDKAVESASKALRLDPGYAGAHVIIATVHEKRNEKEKALEAFEKASKLDPKDSLANEGRVRLSLRSAG